MRQERVQAARPIEASASAASKFALGGAQLDRNVHARQRSRPPSRARARGALAIGILKALSLSTESAAPSTMMACTPCSAAMAAFHAQSDASALARCGESLHIATLFSRADEEAPAASGDETAISALAKPLVSVATGFDISGEVMIEEEFR